MMEETYQYQLIADPEEKISLLREYGWLENQTEPGGFAARLILLAFFEGERIGIAQGSFLAKTSEFMILAMRLVPGHRSASAIRSLLCALLRNAKQQYSCRRYLWRYEVRASKPDPYELLVQGIPQLAAEEKVVQRNYRVKLRGFHHRGAAYTTEHMQELGFRVIHRSDMTEAQGQALQERCRQSDGTLIALHPFVTDYDEETSLLLVDLATEQVCAWMICQKRDDQLLEVQRWYALADCHRKLAGLLFAGYWIRLISEKYTTLTFDVVEANRTMQRFSRVYFGKALQEVSCEKLMTIKDRDNGN
jgi:hypothetical protein